MEHQIQFVPTSLPFQRVCPLNSVVSDSTGNSKMAWHSLSGLQFLAQAISSPPDILLVSPPGWVPWILTDLASHLLLHKLSTVVHSREDPPRTPCTCFINRPLAQYLKCLKNSSRTPSRVSPSPHSSVPSRVPSTCESLRKCLLNEWLSLEKKSYSPGLLKLGCVFLLRILCKKFKFF